MKKLLFAISIPLFSFLGLHAYAADNAATTHELKSNQMRNMDSRNETMPATDDSTKPATEENKEANKEAKKTENKEATKATPQKKPSKTKKKYTSKKNKKK
jgi:outer membrane biosynthesis protein TonB